MFVEDSSFAGPPDKVWMVLLCLLSVMTSLLLTSRRETICVRRSQLELVKLICGREILRVFKSALIQIAWGCIVILNIQFSVRLW